MKKSAITSLEARWSRLGVLLPVRPSAPSPDLERVLLDTAREVAGNARLFPVAVSWLAEFGGFVARHRLKRLVASELEVEYQPALGLILESAIELGASKDLALAAEVCRPSAAPRPLFVSQQSSPLLSSLAERKASVLSRKWGVWSPEITVKRDALRPVEWLLKHNEQYRDRIVRRGDLRCSILESLRRDTDGHVRSEAELARLSGATRAAVHKSVVALVQEGELRYSEQQARARDRGIGLCTAA